MSIPSGKRENENTDRRVDRSQIAEDAQRSLKNPALPAGTAASKTQIKPTSQKVSTVGSTVTNRSGPTVAARELQKWDR